MFSGHIESGHLRPPRVLNNGSLSVWVENESSALLRVQINLTNTLQTIASENISIYGWNIINHGSADAFIKIFDSSATLSSNPLSILFCPLYSSTLNLLERPWISGSNLKVAAVDGISNSSATLTSSVYVEFLYQNS